jgi:alpha-L-rhamnosidase
MAVKNNSLNFPPDAVWIGSDHAFDLREAYLRFRSPADFKLEQQPKQAQLFISADSRYKLWVNGQYVSRGPARSYPHAQCVDRLDLTPYLQIGPNTLAVQVYQPGYSHFSYVHRGMAGLLAHLIIDGQSHLATNTRWRTSRDFSFAATVPPVSIYISGVEDRDLNLTDNWIDPTYDDSGWAAARLVAPVGGYPWTDMQARSLPLLAERDLPMRLVETRRGAIVKKSDIHLALRESWFAASPHKIQADEDGWFNITLAEEETTFWVFDLGRGYSFQGWVEIQSAGGQEQIAISYSEKMQGDEPYLSDPETYCRVRMTDRYRLRAGDQQVEPFALRGGRVLIFQLVGPTSANLKVRFHARVAEYPLEVAHSLTTSNPLLNNIITFCEDTLRACLLDGFVDNPWRESAQWIGDALSDGLVMATMSDDTRPLRRLLELAAQGAYPDGVLPSVLPGEAHAYCVVDFNFQWVELLNFYWKTSRDDSFVSEMWPTLVKMLDRFCQDINPEGLLISQPGRRLFIDWSPASKNEPNAAYNLHFILALQHAVELATTRGADAKANRWSEQAAALRAASRNAFYTRGRWYDDLDRTTFSQLTASLAVLTGVVEAAEETGLLETIAARSLDLDDDHAPNKMVLASPYMHHRVFEALRQGGQPEKVVEIIRRRWGRWVEAGYPTAWENWNVGFPDGSQCHGFSAHPRYHLAEIAREKGGL